MRFSLWFFVRPGHVSGLPEQSCSRTRPPQHFAPCRRGPCGRRCCSGTVWSARSGASTETLTRCVPLPKGRRNRGQTRSGRARIAKRQDVGTYLPERSRDVAGNWRDLRGHRAERNQADSSAPYCGELPFAGICTSRAGRRDGRLEDLCRPLSRRHCQPRREALDRANARRDVPGWPNKTSDQARRRA